MKIVLAYEFKDLDPEVQEKVRDEAINVQLEGEMEAMWDQIQKGDITEERLIEIFGMGSEELEHYEDSSWLARKYYEYFKEGVEDCAEERFIKNAIFQKNGTRLFGVVRLKSDDSISMSDVIKTCLSEGKEVER